MQNESMTARDKNAAVYGPTGGYTSEGDHATSGAIGQVSLTEITATAGYILKLLSESKEMQLLFIGDLSSGEPNCMMVFDHSGELPCLDETVRRLDNSEIIELKHWERFGDIIFLTYGLGSGMTTP